MELLCSSCAHISTSLPSPAISYSKSQLNYVNLYRKSSSIDRSRRRAAVRAQKSDSLVQVDKLIGTSSNSAQEQLDIERGVCVPFRKYTPESVRNLAVYFDTWELLVYDLVCYVFFSQFVHSCLT